MRLKPFRIDFPGVRGVVRLEVIEEPTGLVCVIDKVRGRIDLPRTEWLRSVRDITRWIEGKAIAAGCNEMRLGGRKWQRVLTDYEPLSGVKNGLRKALTNG